MQPTSAPQGWTLRQIAAELGLTETTVSDQLRRAGTTMRRPGPPAHPASTHQIVELGDQGLTWNEVAKRVDMTVSNVWSRYRRTRPPKSPRLGRWQQVLADALDQYLAVRVRAAVADHLGEPPPALGSLVRRAAHSLAALGRAQVLHVPGAHADDDGGDRSYLVLAKPNLIMNDTRLRGWLSREVRLLAGRIPTTTPKLLATSNSLYGMRPLVPGSFRLRVWIAIRLPRSRHPLRMPWYSFARLDRRLSRRIRRDEIRVDPPQT
jgi:predicted DNA-binding transcriptional regulator AlpA